MLKNVKTYEGLREAFKEYPDIQALITRLRDHKEWLFRDTTWGWMSNWFYFAPPTILRERAPLLVHEGQRFDYRCGVCAKGGHTSYAQHTETKSHMEHQLRWINMYGNTDPAEVKALEAKPFGKRYLMDLDVKNSREEVPITVESMADGSIPPGFDKYEVAPKECGYVCFVLQLSYKQATSVKISSSAVQFGSKLTAGLGKTERKQTAYEFFSTAPPKKKVTGGHKQYEKPVLWRTLAVPFNKNGWVDIRIDDEVFHQEYITMPEPGMVAVYNLDDKSYTGRQKRWITANCKKKMTDLTLEEFLQNSYRHVRAGQPWPIQVLGPEDFLISAMVYYSEKKSPYKGYNSYYNYSKGGEWQDFHPAEASSSTPQGSCEKKWNENKNSWNSYNRRDDDGMNTDSPWKAQQGGDQQSTNQWWDNSKYSQDQKKDIIMYLHGDQYRDSAYCPMPGVPTFMWPRPDSGPMKFAVDRPQEEIMHGKIILHPISLTDMYWMRNPNIHDAGTFVPQMPQTLAKLKQIAIDNWGGNEERFFLAGLSMGGYGALELAAYWGPKIIKGALFACPSHDANRQAEWFAPRLREIPMWVFHSRTDTLCKWEETVSLVLRMIDLKAKQVRFSSNGCKDFESHTNTGYCFEYPAPFEWLFSLE